MRLKLNLDGPIARIMPMMSSSPTIDLNEESNSPTHHPPAVSVSKIISDVDKIYYRDTDLPTSYHSIIEDCFFNSEWKDDPTKISYCTERKAWGAFAGKGSYGCTYFKCRGSECNYIMKEQEIGLPFQIEFESMVALQGVRYIPKVWAVWACRGKGYILMEQLEPLHMKTKGDLKRLYPEIAKISEDLMRNGWFHLDTHRGNIMRRKTTGELIIIDFGFAIRLGMNEIIASNEHLKHPMRYHKLLRRGEITFAKLVRYQTRLVADKWNPTYDNESLTPTMSSWWYDIEDMGEKLPDDVLSTFLTYGTPKFIRNMTEPPFKKTQFNEMGPNDILEPSCPLPRVRKQFNVRNAIVKYHEAVVKNKKAKTPSPLKTVPLSPSLPSFDSFSSGSPPPPPPPPKKKKKRVMIPKRPSPPKKKKTKTLSPPKKKKSKTPPSSSKKKKNNGPSSSRITISSSISPKKKISKKRT